ncbi:hypothetical protein BsWGS_25383 [Bradybaena similaris]
MQNTRAEIFGEPWHTAADGRDSEQKQDLEKDGQTILQTLRKQNDHGRCNTKGQRKKTTTPPPPRRFTAQVETTRWTHTPFGRSHDGSRWKNEFRQLRKFSYMRK